MARVREAYLNSSLSYLEIGLRMGYKNPHSARQLAFSFVRHTRHPSAVKLYKFSRAVRVPLYHFLAPSPSKSVLTRS